MTETKTVVDEVQAAMIADPETYWTGIAENGIAMTVAHCKGLAGQLQGMLTELLDLATVQSREIALFRALETRAKTGTLTQERMKDLLDRLNTLREDAVTKAAARMAAAVAAQVTSQPLTKTNGVTSHE